MALDTEGRFSSAADTRLFKRLTPSGVKPALLYASGGAPLVVNRDGNLYYGSGYPGGDDMAPGGLTLTRMSPDGKRTLFAPGFKITLATLNEAVTGLAAGPRAPAVPCECRRAGKGLPVLHGESPARAAPTRRKR